MTGVTWMDDLLAGRVLPVVQAPMAGASGTRLAAAVCDAGGLGTISAAYGATPGSVRESCSELGERAFGIGLMSWQQADLPGVLEAGDPDGITERVAAAAQRWL